MAVVETGWWGLLAMIGATAWAPWMVVALLRRRLVPGTRARYVYATTQWALTGPAVLLWATDYVGGVVGHSAWGLCFGVAYSTVWGINTLHLYRDGDDNWFRRTGRRLRRWATDRLAALTPMPQGASA